MTQSFISLRFEQIEKRLKEVEHLLNLAKAHGQDLEIYQALCRSAHVLLVSHFEGLYKDICRDVIDDINANTDFYQVPKQIFHTHCDFFIQNKEEQKSANAVRIKLIEAFKEHKSKVKVEPFLFLDNKNPTPLIIETILERFGIKNFFWSLTDSDLEVVFEDLKTETKKMNYPGASPLGILKQPQLIAIYLLIFLFSTLILYIFSYHFFRSIFPYCINIISTRPNISSP